MESKAATKYDVATSDARIKEILDSSEKFEEVDQIPSRDKLTYSNGFYVNCTAIFIDIRDSSELPSKHTRPVLGKIYRAYLSECVALINNDPNCREIVINGDCVSGIINTPYTSYIDSAFNTTAKLNSLVNILNWRLEQKGYTPIRCGIGINYGRALMMKTGYSGSGINDVIWMGDVVNQACKLCHQGNKGSRSAIQVSTSIFNNLAHDNKNLLRPVYGLNLQPLSYEGDLVNTEMNNWLTEKKQQAASRKAFACDLPKPGLPTVPYRGLGLVLPPNRFS